MAWSELKYALNNTLGKEDFAPLNVLIGGKEVFTENGVFTVPDNVHEIFITACAGGAGGEGDLTTTSSTYNNYRGGGGGEFVFCKKYSVSPGDNLNIIIGKGGKGGRDRSGAEAAQNGEATIIGNLITLHGGEVGEGGKAGNMVSSLPSGTYGKGGRPGSGYIASMTSDMMFGGNGENGSDYEYVSSGGGNASLGRGGMGYQYGVDDQTYRNGVLGGGGGGGSCREYTASGGDGGDGIVIIAWGAVAETIGMFLGGY